MFTKFAAVLIAASVIAAPALARTASVTTPAPHATIKVVKHVKIGKHHVRYAHARHAKIIKVSFARKHQHHRSHVVRNLHVQAKALRKG